MNQTTTSVAEINLQPGRTPGYSTYVPVRLGKIEVNAFVDSGNTFATIISPQTMTALGITASQLEPIPQLSVGTAAAGKKIKVLGQAPRLELQIGGTPSKIPYSTSRAARVGPSLEPVWAVPQGSRDRSDPLPGHLADTRERSADVLPHHTVSRPSSPEVCTLHVTTPTTGRQQYRPHRPPAKAHSGSEARRIEGRSRCVLLVQLKPPFPAGALVLLQPTARSLLGDNPILQEVQADGSLAVLVNNLECGDVDLEPDTLVGSVQEVTATSTTVHADNSPPPEAATHAEFDALPQDEKIKWLVTQFHLDAAPVLQRDPRLRKEVIRTLLQFSDVISIGGYFKTNLISHPISVYPGTTPIKMKHRPLNPVMEESLRQQIDRWLEQRVVEEADLPWSFPLVPVPKKNS